MKVAIVLGTRPEIIKLCSVVRGCQSHGIPFSLIHTNQHYSANMDAIFFEALKLPAPSHNLGIGSGSHGAMTGKMLIALEEIFQKEQPDVCIVQGDTNTVLAGALAAAKLGIKVAHVEAGLRSGDRTMPEELNRIVVDHLADYLFVPTATQETILLQEGIAREKIHVVGNTVVDAVKQNSALTNDEEVLRRFGIGQHGYFLVTVHRAENVDSRERLQQVVASLAAVHKAYKLPLIYPIHPRTQKMLEQHGIALPDGVQTIEPVGYLEFLPLLKHARAVLTDSGGVQEEACIIGTPCITLRESTERPETEQVGANIVAGTAPQAVLVALEAMLRRDQDWENPFGDGRTAERILAELGKSYDA